MSIEKKEPTLEERKVKALEKIALSVDALTCWLEEIDKEAWGERLEYYLFRAYTKYLTEEEDSNKEDNLRI